MPYSTSRLWQAASKAPAGLKDVHPSSLFFWPLAYASAQLWQPLKVPSLPLTQTACLQAEERTGSGARDCRALAGTRPTGDDEWE